MDIRTVTVGGQKEELIVLSKDEQETWYNESLNRVIHNTRWYLDNLDEVPCFFVKWINYGKKRSKLSKPSVSTPQKQKPL